MKILLYSANFAPEPTGIGKYSGEMAAWLATQGHQVRVVAAPPYYPAWQLATGYAWPPYRREQWQGVDVWRAPLWVPRNPGGMLRVVHLLTFALSSLPVMLSQVLWRPNVVMTVAPALVCAPAGWLTARFCGARAWLHIQDFEVDVAFQMGLLKNKALQRLVLASERWLLRRFDVVSTISRKMMGRLATKGVTPEKICFFPNWVDIDHIRPLANPSSYRVELGIAPDAVVMLFSGTLGNKQGLMVIPDAARRLMQVPGVVFVVCGDGVMKPELEAAARELPNLKLLPLQPFARLSELLGLADVHLLTQSADAEDLVLPSKLTGMLASGRPVIATCNAGTEIAVVVQHCGLVVAPGDGAALALAVEQMVNDVAMRRRLGSQARAYAETNLARDSVLGRLAKKIASNSLEETDETATN
jgi:colanic acid biosynthesis glycosyl transferase WcaI